MKLWEWKLTCKNNKENVNMKFMDMLWLYVVIFMVISFVIFVCCKSCWAFAHKELFNGFRREALVVVVGLDATLVKGPMF